MWVDAIKVFRAQQPLVALLLDAGREHAPGLVEQEEQQQQHHPGELCCWHPCSSSSSSSLSSLGVDGSGGVAVTTPLSKTNLVVRLL